MKYIDYQKRIQKNYGDHFAEIVELFFTKATEFAEEGQIEDAIKLVNDVLIFAKYSNVNYALLYIVGMTCQLYLDNNQPELSEEFFIRGMKIIKESDIDYDRDINNFLDLKSLIDKELKNNSL